MFLPNSVKLEMLNISLENLLGQSNGSTFWKIGLIYNTF